MHAHALELLEEERFSQAAELLGRAVAGAADRLPDTDPRLLRLRLAFATALYAGGDFRRALPELDDLADLLTDLRGPTDEQALACRRQAAHCHGELGEFDEALRDVLLLRQPTAARYGETSDNAYELSLDIARFQAAAGHTEAARQTLRQLQTNAQPRLGPRHPLLQQAGSLLIRLRPTPHIDPP
jgi:tetratricopeptide (TPR) repeat protein